MVRSLPGTPTLLRRSHAAGLMSLFPEPAPPATAAPIAPLAPRSASAAPAPVPTRAPKPLPPGQHKRVPVAIDLLATPHIVVFFDLETTGQYVDPPI